MEVRGFLAKRLGCLIRGRFPKRQVFRKSLFPSRLCNAPAGRREGRLERKIFGSGVRATTGAKFAGTLQYAQAARVPVSGSFGGAFPGVAPGVGFLQVGDGEPEVSLRGGGRAMAEHLLDEADIGPVAAPDEMGCACMPPDVSGDVLGYSGKLCVSLHDVAEGVRVDGASSWKLKPSGARCQPCVTRSSSRIIFQTGAIAACWLSHFCNCSI